jgi:hypothetical protein
MLKTLSKTIVRYLERLWFIGFKLRPHLVYSLALSNRRCHDYKIREIAHAVDKAQKLNTYDPKRVASRAQAINTLISKQASIAPENQRLLDNLGFGIEQGRYAIEFNIGLPSIRHFSEQAVASTAIESSVSEARLYPQSCSRMSMRLVRFIDCKEEASSCFSGMTAFELGAYDLFAVVADITAYDQRAEIFAPYIDGTIFATAFCEALWRREIGSCMLNWSSQSISKERRLRDLAKLSDTDIVIMGIIVGHPSFVPFHAPRKTTDVLLTAV